MKKTRPSVNHSHRAALLALTFTLGLPLLPTHAQAQSTPGASGRVGPIVFADADADEPGRLGDVLEALRQVDLTREQREQIRGILARHQPQISPLVDQLIAERRELREVIRATPINEGTIRTQSAAVAAVEAELAVKRAYAAADVRAILTPAQIAELQKLEAEAMSRVDQRRARVGKWLRNG